MAIVQDAYDIPMDIVTKLAIGEYQRIGSVIRYATGPKKGQIVMHLKPVNVEVAEQVQGICNKAIKFVEQHKKEVGIGAIGAALAGIGIWGYSKWKNYEPKEVKNFRASLKNYIEAMQKGTVNVEVIGKLLDAIEVLKQYKQFEQFNVQLTIDEFDVLVHRIDEYTIKLAKDNSVELSECDLKLNDSAIINLQSHIEAQKKIFELVA